MACASEDGAQHFATKSISILPLYYGPLVKIRIKPSNDEYAISKDLLCTNSPVFSAMFKGPFKESQQMIAELEEMEYVVSVRSVQALIQWLYCRTVKFSINDPGERITAALELVRLADKYIIVGIEAQMAQYIREIIVANPHPIATLYGSRRDTNTYWIAHEHIISASYLRRGHPVRQILATACVSGYLHHKFFKEAEEYPSFAADLLLEVKSTLGRPNSKPAGTFEDPITGRIFELRK
ncbi:hypothetical protein N7456_005594 [Penicillium angulare]|uniref:BTB domain-containing protein n=1 Tax=Penicillium angulare TaxID=116970 RepID=A0A9W9FYT8_9EURO|nr:hypothetical protein N7456_005594 [Penicillium angulare]